MGGGYHFLYHGEHVLQLQKSLPIFLLSRITLLAVPLPTFETECPTLRERLNNIVPNYQYLALFVYQGRGSQGV